MSAHRGVQVPGLAGGDQVPLGVVVSYGLAVALPTLRMACRHHQLYGYVPWLLVPLVAFIAWGFQLAWLLPVGLLAILLAVYLPAVLPRLLAWRGVGGRVLLYEETAEARATVTLQVRRRRRRRPGASCYVEMWNLAAVPTAGRVQPEDGKARAGWRVTLRAVQMAEAAGLDVALRSSTTALATHFYTPMGFTFEQPARPGRKPRMVLRVSMAAAGPAGEA